MDPTEPESNDWESEGLFTTYVEEYSSVSSGPEGTITYRLGILLSPDGRAANVYSVFGTEDSPMSFPPAYQCPTHPFGANTGGTNPAFWVIANSDLSGYAEFDSWITVGITEGDPAGNLLDELIDWDAWTESSSLSTSDGSVFWVNPDDSVATPSFVDASGQPGIVLAQITVPEGSYGTVVMGLQGRSTPDENGNARPDWRQEGVVWHYGETPQCIDFECPSDTHVQIDNAENISGTTESDCCRPITCNEWDINDECPDGKVRNETLNGNSEETCCRQLMCSEYTTCPSDTHVQIDNAENISGYTENQCCRPITCDEWDTPEGVDCEVGTIRNETVNGNSQDDCCSLNGCNFDGINMDAYIINDEIRETITNNPESLFTVDDITDISCSGGYQNNSGENSVTYTCPVNEGSFVLTECLPLSCESNQILNQDNQCMVCPNNTHPNLEQTECIECDSGLTGIDGYCNRCPSNHRWNGVNCELCEDGKYSPDMEVNDREGDIWECRINICNPFVEPNQYPGYIISLGHDNVDEIQISCDEGYRGTPNIICPRHEPDSTILNDFSPPTGCVGITDQCIGNFEPELDFYNFNERTETTQNFCPINKIVREDPLNDNEEKNIQNCCIDRTGFCINNTNTNENYTEYGDNSHGDDKMCPEFHELTQDILILTSGDCCNQRTGYCINNYDTSENYQNFRRNPDDENGVWDTLPEKMCERGYNLTTNTNRKIDDHEGCCEPRFDYCIDNWESSNDIICGTRENYEDNPDIDRNSMYVFNDENISNQEAWNNVFSQCCLEINNRCELNHNPENNVDCYDYGDRFRSRVNGVCINDDNLVYLNDGNEIESEEMCNSDDENINLRWIPYDEIRYNNDEEKQNYCCYEINDDDIINCQTDITNQLCEVHTNTLIPKTDEELQGYEYSNYETLSIEEKKNMCCKPKVNFCFNNADPENNPNVVCPENYNFNMDNMAKCLTDENEEIRCSELFEQEDGENKVYSHCCIERSNFCSYNTDSNEDVICDESSTLKTNSRFIELSDGDNQQDKCCTTNQMCTGNDETSLDVNCRASYNNKKNVIGRCLGDADEIISEITTETECLEFDNTWLNSSEITKNHMDRTEEENCCEIVTDMCSGNTNDDENDFVCNLHHTLKENSENISCPESGCTNSLCCNNRSGKCIGNSDISSEPDIICETRLKDSAENIDGRNIEDCCVREHYCTNNEISTQNVSCKVGRIINPNIDTLIPSDIRNSEDAKETLCCMTNRGEVDKLFSIDMEVEMSDNESSNVQIERFTNMYEGFSNNTLISECSNIKNDILSELNIDESHLTFNCRLNELRNKIVVSAQVISSTSNQIENIDEIVETINNEINLPSLGNRNISITTTSTETTTPTTTSTETTPTSTSTETTTPTTTPTTTSTETTPTTTPTTPTTTPTTTTPTTTPTETTTPTKDNTIYYIVGTILFILMIVFLIGFLLILK